MELKVSSGGIGSPKRDVFRSSRSRNQKTMMSNLMEAIADMNSGGGVISETKEDGVVRVKIKVRKEDLRQMLEMTKSGNKTSTNNNTSYSSSSSSSSSTTTSSSLSLEQRLNLLRRKHLLRGNNIIAGKNGSRRGCRSWSPALQSIPEEV